jgi:FHS family Na+ dependent glucose MFS transporter 1
VLGPPLPRLAEGTHTELGSMGVLFTFLSLGYVLGSLVGGRRLDRLSGNRVLTGALILMASAMGLLPLMAARATT